MDPLLWERVGELADRAPSLSDLRHHRLHLFATSRMRERGETVPLTLLDEERRAAALHVSAPALLRRVRATCDGPIVLLKGLEAAARWPRPRWRPANDIDLLVEDADTVQAALLAGGFVELDDPDLYLQLHHACPIAFAGLPLTVEVHSRPHWPSRKAPGVEDIIAAAQPSTLGIDGILAPCPEHHAVLLAAHAWAHGPLDRIGSLIDVAVMLEAADHAAADAVAEAWELSHVWRATTDAIDEFLTGRPEPARRPLWKRHLAEGRERTVFEEHVTRIVGPITATRGRHAAAAFAGALTAAVRPAAGEDWKTKLSRSGRASVTRPGPDRNMKRR